VATEDPHSVRLTRAWTLVAVAVVFAVVCALIQLSAVRPYLAPAGHGATLEGSTTGLKVTGPRLPMARPPTPGSLGVHITVREVPESSPAAAAGLRKGDVIIRAQNLLTGRSVGVATEPRDTAEAMLRWRDAYWLGTKGPLDLLVTRDGGQVELRVERPPAWDLPWSTWLASALIHIGPILEMLSVVGAAAVLLLLRPRDASALLIVSTLACAGTSTGGSLLGAESSLPGFVSAPLTVFTWMAMPLAFPLIALAILYFPRKSPVLVRHPWLHALPVLVALPMMVPAAGTALFLAGVDGMVDAAAWDASHPAVFYASFAGGLVINIAAMLEGVWRYKHNPDPLDRRRVAVATCTLVLAVTAFTVKDGLPALAALTGRTMHYPWWGTLPLHLLTAFAGVGITYAVAVHRVLAPRVVVRQSLQYALARKTLGTLAALPATLLVVALVEQKDRSLSEIVSGQPLFYAVLLGLTIAAFKFRDRERAWLDRRFFRAEYDARAVLLSLAGRIPYETDPNELTAMVVKQIDAAMRPKMVAVFVAGVEPDTLVPVSVLHGTADTLSERGGIGSMLTWSETPLELYLDDPRSAASRLPPDEIEWLRCTGAVLFVPLSVMEQGSRRLLGALVLGGKRSDEPYSADDRQLLSSIAGQVALALDVARLRRRQASADAQAFEASGRATELPTMTGISTTPMLAECHTCQTCHDSTVPRCPHDGTPLNPGRLPRVVESKYRVDRVLGRGGMGAVYRAHDMRLERDVAIKVVRAELLGDPDARTRFRREAQLVARLQHPGIVAVFDYGTLPDGAAFLVMEYVHGRDLRATLRGDGPLPPSRVAELMLSIAGPVDAAHRQGILHRDLKPENILLPEDGEAAKVLDFGVAKLVSADENDQDDNEASDTLTLAGQPIGTPSYMAPEQLAGSRVSRKTDVFALGVMAYELLTGVPPFGRGPLVEIATRQRTGAGPIERTDVPAVMAAAIARALSPNPDERPDSATAFAASLRV
jgi:tRNA A-37 threonylcarbamoyl transferase component Bud32